MPAPSELQTWSNFCTPGCTPRRFCAVETRKSRAPRGPALEQVKTVRGILKIAYKLLINDKGIFAALLMGITFAVFLMIQVTSMFAGMMLKASATVTNTGAKMWVMDRSVTSVASSIPMPDYMLDSVRSMSGVRWGSMTPASSGDPS